MPSTPRDRLSNARLAFVTGEVDDARLEALLSGGVDIVQLRDDSAGDEPLTALAKRVKPLCEQHDALLILHGRAALAGAAHADGVHLPEAGTEAVAQARALLGPEALIGIDCHSPAEIEAVTELGVDYFHVGEGGVTYASRNSRIPFFAAGEFEPPTVGALAAAGAARIAVTRALLQTDDPAFVAEVMRAEIETPSDFVERYRARTEAQNAAARTRLEPLGPGERPLPLQVAAALAALAGIVNLIAYAAGAKVNGSQLSGGEIAAFTVIALILAAGLWQRNGLAVLAAMAVLAIVVVLFSLFLIEASNVLGVIVPLLFIGVGGWLFWKLIRVLGRIQAPRQ